MGSWLPGPAATAGDDQYVGDAGADIVDGLAGDDILAGGDGDDSLFGGAGADTLTGGAGADLFIYTGIDRADLDTITDFTTGVDRIDLTSVSADVSLVRSGGTSSLIIAHPAGDIVVSVQGVVNAGDLLIHGAVKIIGGPGADTLASGTGPDILIGGGGGDSLTGGSGNDIFRYAAASDSRPDAYDIITDFTTSSDLIDLIAVQPVEVSLVRSGAVTFLFVNTPGGPMTIAANGQVNGIDVLTHDGHGVYMIGDGGANTLIGGMTGDVIQAGAGDDVIIGSRGGDVLFGEAGADTFKYVSVLDSNAMGSDGLFVFETGVDKIDMSGIYATEISLIRSGGSTFLFAATPFGAMQLATVGYDLNGRDVVINHEHGFYIIGDTTADVLIGGANGDVIQAGGGADTIIGGAGGDAIWGGAGSDVFKYLAASDSPAGAADTIFDFQSGMDKIDLTAVRAGASDALGVVSSGGSTFIFVDLHGDGVGDMTLQLSGTAIASGDILF